ncbi:hypothetical protein STEG23_028266 [Scotinomys teguina]
MQKPWRRAAYWLASCDLLSLLSCTTEDSLPRGGFVFHLKIDFTPEYNLVPPAVKFLTIPFHPNVNSNTGQPSIDILDSHDNWNPNYTLQSILLALQVLLSNSSLENPVNLETAQLLIKDESMYRTIVQKLFQPKPQVKEGSPGLPEKPQKSIRTIRTISFNDYYKTWYEIATSKTDEHSRSPYFGDPSFMKQYFKWKRLNRQYHTQWKLKFELLKYRLDRENEPPEHSDNHFAQRMVVIPSPNDLVYESVESETRFDKPKEDQGNENWAAENESDESWEEEVDKLVAWTSALDTDSLDDDEN